MLGKTQHPNAWRNLLEPKCFFPDTEELGHDQRVQIAHQVRMNNNQIRWVLLADMALLNLQLYTPDGLRHERTIASLPRKKLNTRAEISMKVPWHTDDDYEKVITKPVQSPSDHPYLPEFFREVHVVRPYYDDTDLIHIGCVENTGELGELSACLGVSSYQHNFHSRDISREEGVRINTLSNTISNPNNFPVCIRRTPLWGTTNMRGPDGNDLLCVPLKMRRSKTPILRAMIEREEEAIQRRYGHTDFFDRSVQGRMKIALSRLFMSDPLPEKQALWFPFGLNASSQRPTFH